MKESASKTLKKTTQNKKISNPGTLYNPNLKLYFIPVLSLFIFFVILSIINIYLKIQIANTNVYKKPETKLSDFPVLNNQLAPSISAESAIILDDTSKAILYEKKPMLRFSMASTTKLMTAIVALEHFKLNDLLIIRTIQNEGAIVGFKADEQFIFEDLLYALLLPSANDAAYAIADNYPGGLNGFVTKMNEKAKSLNLNYTHYADPAGLDDDGNYTTVGDLAKLSSYALKNPLIAKIASTKNKTIINADGTNSYTLINLNKLLGSDGIVGLKTGYTQGAGEVLVTAKNKRNHLFIIVVMKSENRFSDTEILADYINNSVSFIKPAEYLLSDPDTKYYSQ